MYLVYSYPTIFLNLRASLDSLIFPNELEFYLTHTHTQKTTVKMFIIVYSLLLLLLCSEKAEYNKNGKKLTCSPDIVYAHSCAILFMLKYVCQRILSDLDIKKHIIKKLRCAIRNK